MASLPTRITSQLLATHAAEGLRNPCLISASARRPRRRGDETPRAMDTAAYDRGVGSTRRPPKRDATSRRKAGIKRERGLLCTPPPTPRASSSRALATDLTPSPHRGPRALATQNQHRRVVLCKVLVRIHAESGVFVPRNPLLAQILTSIGATSIARRDGADCSGPKASGPICGSDLWRGPASAKGAMQKRPSYLSTPASRPPATFASPHESTTSGTESQSRSPLIPALPE